MVLTGTGANASALGAGATLAINAGSLAVDGDLTGGAVNVAGGTLTRARRRPRRHRHDQRAGDGRCLCDAQRGAGWVASAR